MGACAIETTITANKENYKDRFRQLVEHEAYLYGHAGYTGSFAEKSSIRIIPPPVGQDYWESRDAQDHYIHMAEKWGSAFGYRLDENTLFIGAWTSE